MGIGTTADQSAATSRPRLIFQSCRRRLWLFLAVACSLCLGWYLAGACLWQLATAAAAQGRLTLASSRVAWYQRLRPWDPQACVLAARWARRRGDSNSWSRIVDHCALRHPTAQLAVERELAYVHSGRLRPDDQAQLNRFHAAGTDPNDVFEAFALGYLARKNYPEAERILAAWEAQQPAAVDALYGRGILARERKDHERAAAHFESVLKRHPRHELANEALAGLLLEARRPGDALEHYLVVIRESPDAPVSRVGAARCLRHLEKWHAAQAMLGALPDQPDPRADVLEEDGLIALESGKYTDASGLLTKAQGVAPLNSDGRLGAALAFTIQGRTADAKVLVEQVARIQRLHCLFVDLVISNTLAPNDVGIREQLQNVAAELKREGS